MDEVVEALEKYQGLVPLVYDVETMGLAEARPQDMPYAVYLKREADKVIADLMESHKMEVEQLLILNREQANAANRLRDSMEQAIRHQKYKRCLAMASEWRNYTEFYGMLSFHHNHAWKCVNRWLKIAEQFKEA